MKHYLAVLLGVLFCFAALPTSAEAREHDRHHRDRHSYRSHSRHYYSSHREHRSKRVWRGAHYTWSRGHRVFVPGHFVVLFY